MKIHFLIPGDIHKLTGGSIYNEKISSGLKGKKHDVIVHQLDDDYPFPSIKSLERCSNEISAISAGEPVIIDSLVFGTIPQLLKELARSNPVMAVIHLLLSENKEYVNCLHNELKRSEQEALKYASKIVATSPYTEVQLLKTGTEEKKVKVIIPGLDNFPRKISYRKRPEKLLCVSNYTSGKGQVVLASALRGLKHIGWELDCYGDPGMDPGYVDLLKMTVKRNGLEGRMKIHPPLKRHELTTAFLDSDLFIHPSAFETYGMALTEALGHGIPVVASTGGDICRTVPEGMGLFFEPGDAAGLSLVLQRLFETPVYNRLCREANGYYRYANSWSRSIDLFEQLITDCCNT